jgi:hypothetical protein
LAIFPSFFEIPHVRLLAIFYKVAAEVAGPVETTEAKWEAGV